MPDAQIRNIERMLLGLVQPISKEDDRIRDEPEAASVEDPIVAIQILEDFSEHKIDQSQNSDRAYDAV